MHILGVYSNAVITTILHGISKVKDQTMNVSPQKLKLTST